jgi:hypothetical protein
MSVTGTFWAYVDDVRLLLTLEIVFHVLLASDTTVDLVLDATATKYHADVAGAKIRLEINMYWRHRSMSAAPKSSHTSIILCVVILNS